MKTIKITRSVTLPDQIKLARYRKTPELGPKILFFSGGSALKKLSQLLIAYTHNSIHLITPFDSGGSTSKIRKAFRMLAIGDLRSRLMALADQSVQGNPSVFKLFAYRFPNDMGQIELAKRLNLIISGKSSLIAAISDPMRKIIRNHLNYFKEKMPDNFDLRGANIGNIVLAGGYLNNNRHIDPVIFLFSRLVEARGVVRPIVSAYLHLSAKLENGETVVGQHLLSGKEAPPIKAPVKKLFLTRNKEKIEPVEIEIRNKVSRLIKEAELICYPMGSFYSSLIVNLLPIGVSQAIVSNPCAKVFIPNSGNDPEQVGMSLYDSLQNLLNYLRKSSNGKMPIESLLNFVILDSRCGKYPQPIEIKKIQRLGITVIDTPLLTENSAPFLDEERLVGILLSLT